MAIIVGANAAELVGGVSDWSRSRLSFRSGSSRAIPSVSFLRTGVGNNVGASSSSQTLLSWRRSCGSSPSAQPCLGRTVEVTAAVVDGEAGDEKRGLLSKDELLMLRKKAADLSAHLQGSSIFLVGMSKSGKTTVGKCLAEAMGHYFFDSQQLVEQAAGDQFSEMAEEEFEDAETEVLMQLSPLVRLIVATGERAVIRPRNWGYLRSGVTVWLDWPVDSLVQRVAAADSESPPEKVLEETREGLKERADFYANADAIVSIEKIAALKDIEDVNSITPPMVAFHILEEIDNVLKKREKS